MQLLFQIGFLDIRIIDLIDVALVGVMFYQLYRLIRGSLAYNIFIGLLIIYLLSLLFRALDMQLSSQILGQFIGVGVLALLVVFQPEVRRFLLYLGRSSEIRSSSLWRRFNFSGFESAASDSLNLQKLQAGIKQFSQRKTGALIVFSQTSKLQFLANTGVELNAIFSSELLESIFHRSSPLHDGAVLIADRRIIAAGCILPISENMNIKAKLGLRHRAAIGITEHSDATTIVVSEETGEVSYAVAGKIYENVSEQQINDLLRRLWDSPE